jgi:NAD(P)-dependent dehydrogenase (short-subunit alcohol dehydrogenase family)
MITRVLQDIDPAKWDEHLYGLTPERWARLRGRSYWITGAGTGYGRCIACALASAEAQVFLTGRRVEKLQESIEEIAALNISTDNCYTVEADLTNYDEVTQACERVKSLCSSLSGLVNNAAMPTEPGSREPLQNGSLEYWNRMMATNVTAAWLLTRMMFPYMLLDGNVRVLFISSEAGWANDTPGNGMYKVSKAALNGLGRAAACEYAHTFPDKDIQMNVLVPGEARTEMNRGSARSPYAVVSMALVLLSHPEGGPNGRYFHCDGRHLNFGNAPPYDKPLI